MKSFSKQFMDDMFLKDFAEATKEGYFRSVRYFFERSKPRKEPLDVLEEDVKRYFHYIKDDLEYGVSSLKITVSGLRFFLRRHWAASGKSSTLFDRLKMRKRFLPF